MIIIIRYSCTLYIFYPCPRYIIRPLYFCILFLHICASYALFLYEKVFTFRNSFHIMLCFFYTVYIKIYIESCHPFFLRCFIVFFFLIRRLTHRNPYPTSLFPSWYIYTQTHISPVRLPRLILFLSCVKVYRVHLECPLCCKTPHSFSKCANRAPFGLILFCYSSKKETTRKLKTDVPCTRPIIYTYTHTHTTSSSQKDYCCFVF